MMVVLCDSPAIACLERESLRHFAECLVFFFLLRGGGCDVEGGPPEDESVLRCLRCLRCDWGGIVLLL